jgi:hypothetical protein
VPKLATIHTKSSSLVGSFVSTNQSVKKAIASLKVVQPKTQHKE